MKAAWELQTHCIYTCARVCSRANQELLCISLYPPPLTHTAPLVCIVFNIAEVETMGYKLAFQPDIFDMISASHLVSLLFVSFLR